MDRTWNIAWYVLFTLIFSLNSSAQQKRIYIANDDHTDYLWSADEHTYKRVFINMLDYYVRKADSTVRLGLPLEQQSRFNCDGNLWLYTYEQNKSAAEVSRLVERIRSGHISVPFNALASTYGGTPAEAVLRGMYYAGSVERRFGLDIDLAVAMEDQTLPLGLASLWAGAGAKYSWKGVCGCATDFKDSDLSGREDEIYWYTGLDGKKILMKWYALNDTIPPGGRDKNESLGGYAEARNPSYAIATCRRKLASPGYRNFQVAGAFGYGWDELETYNADVFVNAAVRGTDESVKVIVSNERDFFLDVESTHGNSLPSQTRTFGNDWDILCASLAETSAKVKRSTEKLRAAEAMASLVAPHALHFGKTLDSLRIKAWMGYGLYWEHDWTADNVKVIPSSQRAAWQRKVQAGIADYTDQLFDSAVVELGKQIKRSGANERFFAFNPLSWKRTGFTDYDYAGPNDIVVIDLATKRPVPHQLYPQNGINYLRILATDVPSAGYKVFEIQPLKAASRLTDAAIVSSDNTVIENTFYRVTVSPTGVIRSIVDKTNHSRECIGEDLANDLGSQGPGGLMTVENRGPVSVTLKAESADPLSHTTRITLYRDLARIDIDNRITQNFTDVRKWKFDFNLKTPTTRYEEVGAVINARLTSNGGHYSTGNASYQFQTLNHFASMNAAGFGITLSNRDCYFMQLGNSTRQFLDEESGTINVLAGGRAVLPDRGIVDQDGEDEFNQSFSITTHASFDAATEMRFALEHQNPLVAGRVTGGLGVYPSTEFSYVTITDTKVLLWALKPAEEGYHERGIIARVWNLGDSASMHDIKFRRTITDAHETSHVETDVGSSAYSRSSLKADVPAKAMTTYRIRFQQ